MEDLYETQSQLLTKLKGLGKKYDDQDPSEKDKFSLNNFRARLQLYSDNFLKTHEKILKNKNKKTAEDKYFVEDIPSQAEDAYYRTKNKFDRLLAEFTSDDGTTELSHLNSSQQHIVHSTSRLPVINVHEFSGKQTEWESFRDLYCSVIHQNETLNNVEKFHYLKSYLRGKAVDLIRDYDISANNYLTAWETLTAYYENKRRLTNKYFYDLLSVKPMKIATSSSLSKLQKSVIDPIESLAKIGRTKETFKDDFAVYLISSNFDPATQMDWHKALGDTVEPPSLQKLRKFVQERIATLESTELTPHTSDSDPNPLPKRGFKSGPTKIQSSHTTHGSNENTISDVCLFCKQRHKLYLCPSFKTVDVNERKDFIIKQQRCLNCFRKHLVKECTSKYNCHYCHKRHHSLLHTHKAKGQPESKTKQSPGDDPEKNREREKSQDVKDDASSSSNRTEIKYSHNVIKPTGVLLATALIRVKGNNGLEVKARALIDPCSQVSLITESLCQRLQLKPRRAHIPLKVTGGSLATTIRKSTEVTIQPHFPSSYSSKIEVLVISKVSSYVPPPMNTSRVLPHLEGLILADPQYMDHNHIDMLLSASVHAEIVEGTIIKGQRNEPIATKSRLGWYLSGDTLSPRKTSSYVTSLHICNDVNLDQTLQKFWVQEEVPKAPMLTPDEQELLAHFEQTHYRTDEGRYVLRLPFKKSVSQNEIDFTPSYRTSEKMLQKMETRFQNDLKLKEMYHNFLNEYETMGHMTNVSFDTSLKRNFIPHHGVWKEKSTSTKLRTVFNGSSKLQCDVSLNDLLQVGPNMLPMLTDLLIGWQNYRYVFVADIEKMYRQILIHPDDRHYQCILWRYDPSEPISAYELNTVTYGLASSPCQANLTVKQLAQDHLIDHPWGAAVLHDEIYMDDVLSGGHTVQEAKDKQNDCTTLLLKGGFPLRKYQSNNPAILQGIVDDYLAESSKSFENHEMQTSVLGLSWNPVKDNFYFNVLQFGDTPKLTKRVILSRTAKLFDPLGWLAPIIINAKILMQLLWQEKKGWDEEISFEHQNSWSKWEDEFSQINCIKIPRWNSYSPQAEIVEIHGFADASKLAYGACLYLRVVHENQAFVSLVTAKSKVAPLKQLSIPRLELSAAYLLAKLTKHYLKTSKIGITSSHLWSDSTDVLQWLKGHPSRWRPFVANRCSSIHDDMPEARWHYVKSKDNPADIVSRGCTVTLLTHNDLWWKGPSWLSQTTRSWVSSHDEPIESREPPPEENSSKPVVHLTTRPHYEFDLIRRFSSVNKLLRVTSYSLRFIVRLLSRVTTKRKEQIKSFLEHLKNYVTVKQGTTRNTLMSNVESRLTKNLSSRIFMVSLMKPPFTYSSKTIQPDELNRARLFIVYLHQNLHFAEVRSSLRKGLRLPNSSPILRLNPFMDGDLIRVGGRLVNSQLPHENKFPLLLHHNDDFTKMLIRQTHLDTFHGGIQLTLGTLRLQYWILKGRVAVKSSIKTCHKCILYSKKGCTQLMGNLPLNRTLPSKPFNISGIDYAGPIKVRLGKVRGNVTQKGYIAIFVCFSTHAVHIEVVEDYSSAAFIAAFHRFTSRRGQCSELHSDQGTTLVGADSELTKMFQGALEWSERVKNQLSISSTKWHFNPPGAPHFGGLWESAVKSMKYHVYRMIGDQVLTFIEYSTLLCRIEAILNSRPLLPLSDDISDLNPLTPAHFLIQRSSYLIPEPNRRNDKIPLSKRWELLTQITQHFWDRWSAEYLTSLQNRTKWTQRQDSIQVGDLVRIKNDTTFPGKWPLGIVKKVHPGTDGLVRTATIKTADTEFKRPIVKLVLLERAGSSTNVRVK